MRRAGSPEVWGTLWGSFHFEFEKAVCRSRGSLICSLPDATVSGRDVFFLSAECVVEMLKEYAAHLLSVVAISSSSERVQRH